MTGKPRNGREARAALAAKLRARLTDSRHDPVAAVEAMRAAHGRPYGQKRSRRVAALSQLPGSVERHSATLKLDADAKRHVVAVAKLRGLDWQSIPVIYTIPDAAGTILVTVEGDTEPCGTAGWYSEGQVRGRPAAESPLARKLRETEERHLLSVGKAEQLAVGFPRPGKELAAKSKDARQENPQTKTNRLRAAIEAERRRGTAERSIAKVAEKEAGASRRHAQRVKKALPLAVAATPATTSPARASSNRRK